MYQTDAVLQYVTERNLPITSAKIRRGDWEDLGDDTPFFLKIQNHAGLPIEKGDERGESAFFVEFCTATTQNLKTSLWFEWLRKAAT